MNQPQLPVYNGFVRRVLLIGVVRHVIGFFIIRNGNLAPCWNVMLLVPALSKAVRSAQQKLADSTYY